MRIVAQPPLHAIAWTTPGGRLVRIRASERRRRQYAWKPDQQSVQ